MLSPQSLTLMSARKHKGLGTLTDLERNLAVAKAEPVEKPLGEWPEKPPVIHVKDGVALTPEGRRMLERAK